MRKRGRVLDPRIARMKQDYLGPSETGLTYERDQQKGVSIGYGAITQPAGEAAMQMDRHLQVLALEQGGREDGYLQPLVSLGLATFGLIEDGLRFGT
jgi:hypothetical protein